MSTITTINAGDTITSSRTVINTNFSNLNTDKIETSVLDTDTALTANSDSKVATQKAVKTYADTLLGQFTSSRSGVSAGPTTSSTQTITHSLGRTPIIIRLHGIGYMDVFGSAATPGFSHGTYNATGNRCLYLAAGQFSVSMDGLTSTSFAVRLATAVTGVETIVATGVVQNLTSTTFDIVWTASSNASNTSFMWEAN